LYKDNKISLKSQFLENANLFWILSRRNKSVSGEKYLTLRNENSSLGSNRCGFLRIALIRLSFLRYRIPNLPKRIYWRLKTASPENFKKALEEKFENFEDEHQNKSPDDTLKQLNQRVIEVAESNVGKSMSNYDPKNKPWWNKEIAHLIKQKKRARRKSQRQRTPENKEHYYNLHRQTKRAIRAAKAEYEERRYEHLAQKSSSAVWTQFNQETNPRTPTPIAIQKPNGDITTDPKQTTKLIRDAFNKISEESKNTNSEHHRTVIDHIKTHKKDWDPTTNEDAYYNKKFNANELEAAIKQAKDGAPGPDEIHYWFLRNSGENFRKAFLQTINKFWKEGRMPTTWKTADIIPIPKPKKDATKTKNYRPISLLSCAGKTMERMIHNRLYWEAETNEWLSPQQSAFRHGRSTTDPLLNLTEDAHQAFSKRKEVIAVFLDLEKAYDSVWHDGLIYKLHQKGLRGRMLHFLNDYLRERKCRVKIHGTESEPYTPTAGVPQGSVLSTLLFNLYVDDVLSLNDPKVNKALFADDITLWTRCQSRKTGTKTMNKALRKLNKWAKEWKLSISETKSSYLVLSRRTRKPDWPYPPRLNNRALTQTKNPRILGITLDSKLNWTEHINTIYQSANRKLNILKRFAGRTYAKRRNVRMLYLSFVRPTLEYASACWTSAADHKLKQLQRIQNSALRLITGATISTPIEVLHADTNIPPLQTRWDQDLIRTVFRNLRQDTTKIAHKLNQQAQTGPKESPFTRTGKLLNRLFGDTIPRSAGMPPPVPPQPPTINAEQRPTKAYTILFRDVTKLLKSEWHTNYENSNKGDHYRNLRPKIEPIWPHTNLRTYRHSTTIFRMRSGHNNLGAHTKIHEQKECDKCQTEDSVEHLLLHCRKYDNQRRHLVDKLKTKTKLKISTELLLGRPNNKHLSNETLCAIATEVADFVLKTRPDI